ncbi:molybdate ABC transporter substrate-binding protein [Alteromonas gracilis]|uniref:molybdate ABC transporter substrate-binding protein n=1 Tax=Alteromonas gracilis TaxID=1479524 RepID=UPI002FE3085A
MRLSSFVNLAMLILVSASVALGVTAFSSSVAHASSFEAANNNVNEGSVISAEKQNQSVKFKRDEKINVAVAANFAKPLKSIADQFTELTGIEVAVTISSSGTLYAQIQHGASFDVFLSADRARPQALVDNNLVHHGNLVDYAKGKLAFVYSGDLSDAQSCEHVAAETKEQRNVQRTDCLSKQLIQLIGNPQNKLAIAHPKLAPYGTAAQQTLQNLSLWQSFLPHRVMGKNVLQTLQFYTTGSVKGAFIAYSLALDLPSNFASTVAVNNVAPTTVISPVPEILYQPIIQSLVVNSKTAAVLTPNLFDVMAIGEPQALEEPGDENKHEASKQFNLSDANGVSSASLFVQYLMSQGVQHSLIEWGYEPVNTLGVGQ